MRVASLLLVIPLLAGCNLLALTRSSEVVRARVAGITAEPAEIGLGQSTTMEALLVHPERPAPELGAVWFACLAAGGATGCLGLDFGSIVAPGDDDDDDLPDDLDPRDLQFGVGDSFTYTAHGSLVEEAWAELEPQDRVEGLTVLVSVNLVRASNESLEQMLFDLGAAAQTGDQETVERLGDEFAALLENGISAARRIVISDKTADEPGVVDCPITDLLPNTNPRLTGLLLHPDELGDDAGFELGSVFFAEPGATLVLRPVVDDATREDYIYISTDGDTLCRREAPYLAWMSNGGTLDGEYSFIADEGDLDEVAGRPKVNTLHLPEDFTDAIDLWIVIRDRRGGLTWGHWSVLPETVE